MPLLTRRVLNAPSLNQVPAMIQDLNRRNLRWGKGLGRDESRKTVIVNHESSTDSGESGVLGEGADGRGLYTAVHNYARGKIRKACRGRKLGIWEGEIKK